MKSEIYTKITKFLSKANHFHTEEDVVYFLVEIRKLLQIENIVNKYKIVKFYADWALHPIRNQNLNYIDEILLKIESNPSFEGSKIVLMDDFKVSLSQLLQELSIVDFTKIEDKWIYFFYNFTKVLNDQKILLNTIKSSRVEYITYSIKSEEKLILIKIKLKEIETPLQFASGAYIRLLEKKKLYFLR